MFATVRHLQLRLFIVWQVLRDSKGKLLEMPANTRLDRKRLTVPNALAYHGIISLLLIEDFVVQAPCVIVIGVFFTKSGVR